MCPVYHTIGTTAPRWKLQSLPKVASSSTGCSSIPRPQAWAAVTKENPGFRKDANAARAAFTKFLDKYAKVKKNLKHGHLPSGQARPKDMHPRICLYWSDVQASGAALLRGDGGAEEPIGAEGADLLQKPPSSSRKRDATDVFLVVEDDDEEDGRARRHEFLRQEAEEAGVSVDEMARAVANGGSSGGTGASAPKRPRDRMTLGKGGGAGGALESIMRLEKELEKDKQASVAACMASVASGFTALAGAIASRSAPNPAPAGAGGIMAEFLQFTEGLKNLHSVGCRFSQDFVQAVQEYAVEILQRAQRAWGVAGYNAPRVDGSVESSADSSPPRE